MIRTTKIYANGGRYGKKKWNAFNGTWSLNSGTYGNDTWDLYGGRNTWGHDELKNAFQLKNIML